jgi:deoxycytidylate deaminase
MSRISKFIRLASEQASKSTMYFRHGAVVVKGGKVMALGFNKPSQIELDQKHYCCSVHSELEAMSRLKQGSKEKGKER